VVAATAARAVSGWINVALVAAFIVLATLWLLANWTLAAASKS